MNADEPHTNERQSLQTRLLDAVKQCQVRFGGRTELATDTDSRVSCLCAAWESVLQHGMKGETRAIAALKQVSEITGLNKVAGIFGEKSLEKDLVFWNYVKEILSTHEASRFMTLKNINTDSGRGRAWLRASLNEHSLERYMHMLIENDTLLSQYYESWAFLRDQEKSSMLPMMARGLDSILFAITVDNGELNTVRQTPTSVVNVGNLGNVLGKPDVEIRPVIAGESPTPDREKKKERRKKKKVTHIVSFDDDETGSGKFSRVSQSEKSGSFSSTSESLGKSPDNFQSVLNETSTTDAKISANIEGAGFKTIQTAGSVTQNSQSSAMTQKNQSGAMTQMDQSDSMLNGDKEQSSSSHNRTINREPSIASGRSRQSQGSFSSADFELSMEISGAYMTPVTPGGRAAIEDDDTGLGRSYDSATNSLSAYNGDDIQSATYALKQAQISFSGGHRTQGDGGNVAEDIHSDRMSTEELKKAVVSMMLRKDEVEEQNKTLTQMLEQEMETSSMLRAEMEEMKQMETVRQEKEQAKLQTLQKENELLKHQLRKYVNAVQLLRTEGTSVDVSLGIHVEEPQPTIPPEKPKSDYSHEAEEYEKKLIQVAEMHGELMEFNDLLRRQLNIRESMLRRLQNELVDLRGPLPHDITFTDDLLMMGAESLTIQQTRLINVWIPSAFLRGSASDSHHVYQVYVRIKDEEWNIYKRYKQFHELQSGMKKKYPLTVKFEFPPKKSFGKKDSKVVESRRHILQTYLRCLINHILEKEPTLSDNPCKQTLLDVVPFFSDKIPDKERKRQKRKSEGQRSPLSSSPGQAAPVPEQYSGL